jgi:hypothetical protein
VSAEPEIECIPLDGKEDFLILACDGLWDYVNPDDIAIAVYNYLRINNGKCISLNIPARIFVPLHSYSYFTLTSDDCLIQK